MTNVENQKLINHQRDVVSAAYTYYNLGNVNLIFLANSFRVNTNVISDWLCEAVEKKYIPDDIAAFIKEKHIEEYESRHNISDSSLRRKYDEAFERRSCIKGTINPVVMAAISA